MLCPYCSKEMEEGIIESPNAIVWEKGLVKGSPIRLRNAVSEDVIMFSKRPWHELYNPTVIAYAWKDCKKIIIDYDDKAETDFNQR